MFSLVLIHQVTEAIGRVASGGGSAAGPTPTCISWAVSVGRSSDAMHGPEGGGGSEG